MSGTIGRLMWRVLFEPRDLWIGVFWDRNVRGDLVVYLCLIPCFPLRLTVRR